MHVTHSVRLILDLDDLARGRTPASSLIWNASLEAQLLNVRAVLDFLADDAPQPRRGEDSVDDVTAHHYLPSWTGVKGEELRGRLVAYRIVVNKHVAHLTWTRVAS